MMKKIDRFVLNITLFLLLVPLLTACNKQPELTTLLDPTPDQYMPTSEHGVSLKLQETIYTESPMTIETTVTNDSDNNYTIGEFYHLEVLKEEQWYILTYSDKVFFEHPEFKDFGLKLQAHSSMDQSFSLENLGITLPPGQYRLAKTVLSKGEPFYELSIAAPFTVQ